ncbi:hypothetical protein RHSIM_Rhsim01G0229700 [Rhododendron simsii]|uniref:Myb-like domain-containing protein n=1 Tax=Rhododendron simsii TaxID=118357 RepID=A0A834LWA9_RHOSS|nr:hypothetical protein RHSIM_Rhsim01G0229700 [Rhododendron simsii]
MREKLRFLICVWFIVSCLSKFVVARNSLRRRFSRDLFFGEAIFAKVCGGGCQSGLASRLTWGPGHVSVVVFGMGPFPVSNDFPLPISLHPTFPSPTPHHSPSLHKPRSSSLSLSLHPPLLPLSLLSPQPEPRQSLLFWLALSLLLGPFAPSFLTAGDIRVGAGKLLEPLLLPIPSPDLDKKTPIYGSCQSEANLGDKSPVEGGGEREWDEGDYKLLKKLLVKHPVGKPGRWEAEAEAFRGRHGVESVIKAAKSMGKRKTNDADSFVRFLKDRKPVDKRIEKAESGGDGGVVVEGPRVAFPKDVPMRWEKIAAAVPGKSKAGCVKRVAELKKGFTSSKASAEA